MGSYHLHDLLCVAGKLFDPRAALSEKGSSLWRLGIFLYSSSLSAPCRRLGPLRVTAIRGGRRISVGIREGGWNCLERDCGGRDRRPKGHALIKGTGIKGDGSSNEKIPPRVPETGRAAPSWAGRGAPRYKEEGEKGVKEKVSSFHVEGVRKEKKESV